MWWLLLSCSDPAPPPASPPAPAPVVAELAPPPPAPPAEPAPPEYHFEVLPIPADRRAKMTGTSWHEGCPLGLDELRLVRLSHWDMDGAVQTGELIVAAEQAEGLEPVFRTLFDARFPIARMRPVSDYGGDDDASMAADNTSAFNCRPVTGGTRWSEHSHGAALDLNPVENPYVSGRRVLPPGGRPYARRDLGAPGMLVEDGVAVGAFAAAGWKWGGRWRRTKDFQHFSVSGR